MVEIIATKNGTCAYCNEMIRVGEIYVESGTYLPRSFHKNCYRKIW